MATGADTLRVLEWDKVRQQLAGLSHTPEARRRLEVLKPFERFDDQLEALAFAGECLELIEHNDSLPLRPLPELEPLLLKAVPAGSQMDGSDLALAGDFCQLITDLSGFERTLPDRFLHVKELLRCLVPAPEFARAVVRALEPDGTVLDRASPALSRLRVQRQRLERALLATLEKTALLVSPDSVVTLREGRYVVSVPERHRGMVPGIVHDRSQSGTTYFIEPLAVLEQGNQLRASDADIRDEIRRILRDLTSQLRDLLPALREDLRLVVDLDVVWTKARWAGRVGGRVPGRTREPELRLHGARHPLLLGQFVTQTGSAQQAQESVIPFDLSLDSQCRSVVISGPNTGGKTVCLKTLGLTVLLAQAGVPCSVASDSTIGDFDAVFADIGDDQSLALSLSTFSAHLKHVGEACRQASDRSLVLLDELGVGTDPEEGGALALAVLEALLQRDAAVVVTTHYPVLKLLNRDDGRVAHAAFAFNEADLAPTYELIRGRPGQSYALDVARRLGFPPDIVAKARDLVSSESRDLTALLDRLSAQERELSAAGIRQLEKEARLDALLSYNQQEEARWRLLHTRAEAEARQQAEAIVADVRRETEHLVADIRRTRAHPDTVRKAHRQLEALQDKTRETRPAAASGDLEGGMQVVVTDLGARGEITKISADGQRVSVRIGNVTYTVAPDRVARTTDAQSAPSSGRLKTSGHAFADEVDVRGFAVEEAILEVDSAIQAASSGGGTQLRVIHGIGTGVLRRELSTWFRRHALVAEFRRGGPGEGSDGVTVLTLKP